MGGAAFFQVQNIRKIGLLLVVHIVEFISLSSVFFIEPSIFSHVLFAELKTLFVQQDFFAPCRKSVNLNPEFSSFIVF